MCLLLTVKGELEQTRKSATAGTGNTRSLRSRRNEEVTKKARPRPVENRLKRAVSNSSSALPAGTRHTVSLRTNTSSLPQQVRARSSDGSKSSARDNAESAMRTSTPVKRAARQMPAADVAFESSSPKSPASAVDVQMRSKTQVVAGDGLYSKKSQISQSSCTITASPLSTRSRSSVSFSPAKSSRDNHTSHALPWPKTAVVTYQRKRTVDNVRTTKNLRSTASLEHLSTTDNVDGSPKERGSPGKVGKIQRPDSLRSKTSSLVSSCEESKLHTGPTGESPRKRRDVAVQADSQSSGGSSRLFRHGSLHSTASSSPSRPSGRRSNVVMESCSSAKTAVTAKSSEQYDTCFESANSQLQDTEDIDDEELDRLARLAHGSPQSAVVLHSLEDNSVTSCTAVPEEQPVRASKISKEKPTAVRTQRTVAVTDDMSDESLDSGRTSSAKKRRTEIDKREVTELLPKSRRVTSQLAADAGKKLVKSASGTDNVAAASSQHHVNMDRWKRSATEVSSSGVDKASVEPVAGPSGIASRITRSQNITKEKLSGSGKNQNRLFCVVNNVK